MYLPVPGFDPMSSVILSKGAGHLKESNPDEITACDYIPNLLTN